MAKPTCPLCHTPHLKPHCHDKHPTCNWLRCTSRQCRALIDIARRRAVDADGHTVQLPPTPA